MHITRTAQLETPRVEYSSRERRQMIALLSSRLAESLDLGLQVRHAQWNVSGVRFSALHDLFGRLHDDLDRYADMLAERVVQLGGSVNGTKWAVVDESHLAIYPTSIEGAGHAAAVAAALASWSSILHPLIDLAGGLNDPMTTDILIEIARGVDNWHWLVAANISRR